MFYVWCELVCYSCARSTAGRSVSGSAIPKREMKAEAKREGWKFKHNESYCSSFCLSQHEWQIEEAKYKAFEAATLKELYPNEQEIQP